MNEERIKDWKKYFCSFRFSNFDKALKVAEQVKNDAAGLKITNQLFSICGKEGLEKLARFGLEIFLDIKLLDVELQSKKLCKA